MSEKDIRAHLRRVVLQKLLKMSSAFAAGVEPGEKVDVASECALLVGGLCVLDNQLWEEVLIGNRSYRLFWVAVARKLVSDSRHIKWRLQRILTAAPLYEEADRRTSISGESEYVLAICSPYFPASTSELSSSGSEQDQPLSPSRRV